MNTSQYTETQRIELATANAFFAIYNANRNTTYAVIRVAGNNEVPDVLAEDETGNSFGLEITLTEDRSGDIIEALERRDSPSLEELKRHLEAVCAGDKPLQVISLLDHALPILLQRIDKKLIKRYGSNTALVVRDTSPLWDWEPAVPVIQEHLKAKTVPFDLGIWILALDKTTMVQVYPPTLLR